ncbi:RHS repeat-associated core domain-containing protein [Colwellia chukchiensis]|uniref:RHS repeat-associated core domain-containing protein n=1 Tax=Colwellia chukchiensis TaxID=641665 RepID=A0A1H7L1L2_9GAMM|nr:RHS repeat-associated core domain-containing protein [Colwellia chukchiensis]SEK92911.1 RHS repeat-associated core domain-containing protein [Colwellia chukchiensis]
MNHIFITLQIKCIFTIILSIFSFLSLAVEEVEPIVEWEKKQNAEQRLEIFGDDFLGDAIDPHTGTLVFNQTDISLPGNSHLPVTLSRKRTSGFTYKDGIDAEFGDWTLSVPRIKVISLDVRPWIGARCSKPSKEILSAYNYGRIGSHTTVTTTGYSNGIQLEVPGQASQQIIDNNGVAIWPSTAKKVTVKNWYFTCTIASDGGEGLIGHAPNGDVYRFDHAYVLDSPKMGFVGANPLERNVYILAASQVSDVNGNWVKYQYDSLNRLTSIYAKDERRINLGYTGDSKLIRTAAVAGKVWHYDYRVNSFIRTDWMPFAGQALNGQVLAKVTQPDGNYWSFNLDLMTGTPAPSGRSRCPKWSRTVSLTHPYGATGTFVLKDTEHRQIYAKQARRLENCPDSEPEKPPGGIGGSDIPLDDDVTTSTMAVVEKSVTGPSMTPATWRYQYESDKGPSESSSADRTNWTKVSTPEGHHTYYHAWVNEPLGGRLVKKEIRSTATGAIKKAEQYTYLKEIPVGNSPIIQAPGPGDAKNPIHTTKIVITQDGDTYTQEFGFNTNHSSSNYSYAKPIMQSVKSNISTLARVTLTEYSHKKNKWILGLPTKQTINSRVTQENTYNTLGHKIAEQRNGALFATYSYHNDGTFASATDANGREIQALLYKRGTPQKVTRADGNSVYQYVDDFGRISSITDALGNTVSYSRDSMGRLITADLPDSWASVNHSYNFSSSPIHTITKGNAESTITYDAMFRPILVATKDTLTNKTTFINYDYDSAGREVFSSFPSVSSTSTAGIASEYDSLNRITRKRETVAPYATTLTSYHSGHRRTETDPAGNKTDYYHYGYDGANYKDVKSLYSPLGIFTNINKNVWGEITSIKQWGSQGSGGSGNTPGDDIGGGSGGGAVITPVIPTNEGDKKIKPPGIDIPIELNSASNDIDDRDSGTGISLTRSYYYDSKHRLCRISEPDVGDTLYQYDASGWLIAYQKGAISGSACVSPSGNAKVSLLRDDVGRIIKRDFSHSLTHDITKTYDANGNVLTVNRDGIEWIYSYNSLNFPTSEQLKVDGRQYVLAYGYNSAGQLSSMVYPSGKTINYNPDGLGRPRQANYGGSYYASNIQYHASGQVSRLSYGNGHVFQQWLNERLLPSRLLTSKGNIKALDMSYNYDQRKLTTSITDTALGNNNRMMTYDALERITSASGPWGSGEFSYDSLGNILTKDLGSRKVSLSYDADNRLIGAIDTGGLGGNTGTRDFAYDNRGNTITAGNLNFNYDYADQPVSMYGSTSGSYRYDGNLKRVKATIAGKTIYNVYNLAGKLIHIDNVSSNKRTDYINAGSRTVARVVNDVPTYVHHDSLGSPVSGTNAAGGILWRERYSPFGITIDNAEANNDQAGYTGHIKDSDTGLVYMQARYYDPVIGRFYSNDPVDYAGHLQRGNPVQGFNRYAYVNNNPYKYTDPDGEFLNIITGAIGAYTAYNQARDMGFSKEEALIAGGVGALIGVVSGGAGSKVATGLIKQLAPATTKQLAKETAKTVTAGATSAGVTQASADAAGDIAQGNPVDVDGAKVAGKAFEGGATAAIGTVSTVGVVGKNVVSEVAEAAIVITAQEVRREDQ